MSFRHLEAGILMLAACAACAAPTHPPSVALVTTSSTATAPDVTPAPTVPPDIQFAKLQVRDDPPDDGRYQASQWRFTDSDRDGCRDDHQAEARLVEGGGAAARVDTWDPNERCRPLTGLWVSAYDGVHHTDARALQVDHVVARKDAYVSGGYIWDRATIVGFVGDQANLIPVTAAVNAAKGERGPDRWTPPAPHARCLYATVYTYTKVRWNLTVTNAQRAALASMLATC